MHTKSKMKRAISISRSSRGWLILCLSAVAAKRGSNLPVRDAPPRGGGSVKPKPLFTPGRVPIELNPNYVPPSPSFNSNARLLTSSPSPSGGLESPALLQRYTTHEDDTPTSTITTPNTKVAATSGSAAPPAVSTATEYRAGFVSWDKPSTPSTQSWLSNLKIQLLSMYRVSPSLTATMVACIGVFLAWQVNPRARILQEYFVMSRANLRAFRWPSLLLSAVSHVNLWHLLVNLYALWNFGPVVQRILIQRGHRMGFFLGGAALASSLIFLMLQNYSGASGGLGLSGVTLALLAVFARTYPSHILGVRLAGILPIRMKAGNFLACMTAWSFVGSFSKIRSNVGHAAHLGGLLFGVAYHELVLNRWHKRRHAEAWKWAHA